MVFAGWKNLSDTMKTKLLSLAFLGCVGLPQANAQSSDEEFEQFRKEMHEDYQDFRKQMFKEYTDFILKLKALEMSVKTGNYTKAIEYFNSLFGE